MCIRDSIYCALAKQEQKQCTIIYFNERMWLLRYKEKIMEVIADMVKNLKEII